MIQQLKQTAHRVEVTTLSGRVYRKNKKGYWVYGLLNIPVTDFQQRKLDYAFHNFKNQTKQTL